MKQLRNIVAGMLVLIGGMLPATTFAQEPVPGDTTATLQQEIIVGKDTINQEANRSFSYIRDMPLVRISNMAEHNAFYIYLISFLIDCVFTYNNLLLQSSGGITRYRLLCKGCSRRLL